MDLSTFGVFFTAALVLAVIPGPGMLYVLARTVKGGRREGILSTLGTGVAGLLHTLAAALGVSAILATSAAAFFVVKWLGVAYLVYLGVRTLLERDTLEVAPELVRPTPRGALVQGFVTRPSNGLVLLGVHPAVREPRRVGLRAVRLIGLRDDAPDERRGPPWWRSWRVP